jgi:hypothetical protein
VLIVVLIAIVGVGLASIATGPAVGPLQSGLISTTVPSMSPATASPSASPSVEPERTQTPEAGVYPYPDGCEAYGYTRRRCDAVVAWATDQLPKNHASIVSIDLLAETHKVLRAFMFAGAVRFQLADVSRPAFTLLCSPLDRYSLLCTNTPEIRIQAYGGYSDIPCGREPADSPDDCATPLPTPIPAVQARARPLTIANLDVSLTHTGHYELDLGRALLPNGILTEGTFRLADPTTQSFAVKDSIRLLIEAVDPTHRPFDNLYRHGRYPGTEEVTVSLIFDVTDLEPGAMLQIRDLVVR